MQLKRSKKEYSDTWVQTASLIITLVFTVLATFGVLSPGDSAEATPIVGTFLGAVSTAIAAAIQFIGILFKSTPKV